MVHVQQCTAKCLRLSDQALLYLGRENPLSFGDPENPPLQLKGCMSSPVYTYIVPYPPSHITPTCPAPFFYPSPPTFHLPPHLKNLSFGDPANDISPSEQFLLRGGTAGGG